MSDCAIETSGLTKVYNGTLRAVDDVSLQVPAGSTFGLLGANGAGKTTFVKMLLSSCHPTAGRARLFGREASDPESRRSVGYLPENHRFPTYLTGWEMLDFYGALSGLDAAARRRRIPEVLDLVGLESRAHHLRLNQYSKGMLQRVGLAQALLHSPRLLILDEPSDGVDPVGRKQIRDVLQALEREGVTVFLNSHLLAEVELFCHDVAIIQKGRLALTGRVKDLTSGSGYKVEVSEVPEALRTEIRARAKGETTGAEGIQWMFATRGEANAAVDLLRAGGCEIEGFSRSRSTLEDVFIRTVQSKAEAA